jgi:isocitrate/isopropylmalate dehydrogenase
VEQTLANGRGLTRDLGGQGNTRGLTDQIIANLDGKAA